jgi:long-chain acyl-CoA synthetase
MEKLFGWAFDKVPKGKVSREDDTLWFGNMVKKIPVPKDLPPLTQKGTDTAEIIYTGGTTKFPKGVPISHGLYLESAGEQISICDPLFKPEENVVLGSAPLFHILGQTCALSTLLVGGAIVLMPKVNLDAIFDAVQRLQSQNVDRCADPLPHDSGS